MIYKDKGVVIKQVNYGEADRILSIITANHGKISAIAKGVRRLKSRKAAACGLFVESKFVFVEGRSLDIITEAESILSYDSIKEDLERVAVLFYVSELLDRLVEGDDKLNGWSVFELLCDFLRLVERNGSDAMFNLVRGFETKLLGLMGLSPELHVCIVCKKKLENGSPLFFDLGSGGIKCEDCNNVSLDGGRIITSDSIKSLRFLYEQDLKNAPLLKLNDAVRSEVKNFTQAYLEYFHSFQIKSKGIYKI